jgi:hypothetical protein
MTVSGDLSFTELRLANMTDPHELNPLRSQHHPLHAAYVMPMKELFAKLDDVMLAQTLAELIIQADWMAAERGLDIVHAIRNRFAAGPPPIPEMTAEEIASDYLERKRSGT